MCKAARPVPRDALAPPEELVLRLEADPVPAKAFAALTRGRPHGWILMIGQAKQAQTRINRPPL